MKRRRIHIVITTISLGTLLWLSVNLREQYTVAVNAPLTIEEVPEGMAIRSAVPRSIQLRLRGEGWRLAGLLLGPAIDLRIPLSTLPHGNRTVTINQINERLTLSPGVQLVRIQPDTVAIALDVMATRRVPVVSAVAVSFREGYGQVGTTQLVPDSVTVSGAETVIRQITEWRTAPVRFDDLKAPVQETVPLATGEGPAVQCSPPEVEVHVNVQPFAEKVFSGLPVAVTGLPANREVILIPPKVEIVARGGIRQLASILPVDFQVAMPFDRIIADTTGSVVPDVQPPSGIQIVTRRPDRLQYIVRKRL